MPSQFVGHTEFIAAFIPDLELLITEAMDEWKVPGLAVAVVQNGRWRSSEPMAFAMARFRKANYELWGDLAGTFRRCRPARN